MMKRIAAALVLLAAFTPSAAQAAGERWELRWNPSPWRDGLNAFEAPEDDRRGSHAEAAPHVSTEGNGWRFDMHTIDRDGSDRQRNEVRGMRDGRGRALEMRKDETWRISWQMYIPGTLDATSSFSHIWQLKTSDIGTPVAQLSLPIKDGVQKIEARYWTLPDNATHGFASYDLEKIQDRWVTTTVEIKSSDRGYMRWVLKDGHRTLVDQRIDDIDLYWTEEQYNRPKWGIYRSIRSAGLQETHMLVRDLKAWTLGPVNPPVRLPPPDTAAGAYEAERKGTIFEGAAEPVYCRICSGGLKTILIGGNTYDYTVVKGILSETAATRQLTIHAVVNGTQAYRISVNGADSIEVPMTGTPDRITTVTVPVPLIAGVNQIRFFNLTARTPELDKIVIS
ncbi:heparin lyase I family protein [Nonomuraea typhae]|uniref:heparin lyase I family protein n=1 Tax=Nonomuraea typhae TaxID=2603600 RepID=UPI0012FA37C1|nr:heparin lyase I family protein [Nonomuraea typhae]